MPNEVRLFSKCSSRSDIVFTFGLVLLTAGLALLSTPAALIVPGALLVWLAIPPVRIFGIGADELSRAAPIAVAAGDVRAVGQLLVRRRRTEDARIDGMSV
jgi:hypothetical protein